VFAARAAHLHTSLQLSTRGPFLVLEANVRDLLKAPKRKRLLVYVAGMLSDLMLLAVGAALLTLIVRGALPWPAWAVGVLRQIILLRVLGLAWQLLFALKTDVTNVIMDLAGEPNLHRKSVAWLREVWTQIRNPLGEGRARHRQDRRWPSASPATKRYALAVVVGAVVAAVFYAGVTLRLLLELILRAGLSIAQGAGGNLPALLDGLAVLALLGWMLALTARTRRRSH